MQNTYTNNGFGYSPENDVPVKHGRNWWKFLAYVDGNRGDWFEFKLVKTLQDFPGPAGEVLQWESDVVAQNLNIFPTDRDHAADAPRRKTTNHLGRLGYITRAVFRQPAGAAAAGRALDSAGNSGAPALSGGAIAGVTVAAVGVVAVAALLIALAVRRRHTAGAYAAM